MEINEINQKPIKLSELLNENFENEQNKIAKTTKKNNIRFDEIVRDNSARTESDYSGNKYKDKKTIIIVESEFGIEKNALGRLNHRAIYLKNKSKNNAELWILYSKSIYETFKKFFTGKIDRVIIGNYEKIDSLDNLIRDFKRKGFDENKIIYQRIRDFREYVIDFSNRTGIKINISKRNKLNKEQAKDGDISTNNNLASDYYPTNEISLEDNTSNASKDTDKKNFVQEILNNDSEIDSLFRAK